jgi:GTPase-activating protein that regulates ARFs (ADP-ribosylation factors), involved in ARF-mediated vesicular transport
VSNNQLNFIDSVYTFYRVNVTVLILTHHFYHVLVLKLNSGKEKEVLAMENGGNAKVNAIFEANLDNPSAKPTAGASGPVRERFIRDKYERRKYYNPIVLQNYTSSMAPSSSSSAAAAPSPSSSAAVVSSARRSPSEVAKLRAQARRSKSLPVDSWSAAKTPSSAAPPPPPQPQPEMDLLDFSAPTVTDPGSPPKPPSAAPSPTLDMFKNMSMAMCGGGVASTTAEGEVVDKRSQSLSTSTASGSNGMNSVAPQRESKKMTSEEILAMFHAPSVPQQQQFGNFSHFNNNMNHGMVGSGGNANMNMMEMTSNNISNNARGMGGMGMMYNQNQNMMQHTNMFGGMGFQQQQSQMMGMSGGGINNNNGMNINNMAMGQYHSQNNNSFGMNNNIMMQQQQLPPPPPPPPPMGGHSSNLSTMGGTGMAMAYNGNMGYQGNVASGNNQNAHKGNDNSFGDFMGGSSNNQHQFASFGSFR